MLLTGPKRKKSRWGMLVDRIKMLRYNTFDVQLLKSFDWLLLAMVLAISVFGVICIFAATGLPTEQPANSFLDLIRTQQIYYPRLQIFWILTGIVFMALMVVVDYEVIGQLSDMLYWFNIGLLVVVLFMERGRGGMAGWFRWGSDAARTIQPAEFGKLAIIVALAKLFAMRKKPISRVAELLPVLAYVGLPLVLIAAQPDYGTAMVYVVIFAVTLYAAGTSNKLLIGMVCLAILMLVPLWFFMQNAESNFRAMRILAFLNPGVDTLNSNYQTNNSMIAFGSGGLWGKGMFSPGSFATLNYIPDDYTDFIFAIVGESFGLVGAGALTIGYLLILFRLIWIANHAADAFGTYMVIGVMAMLLFHIMENICMVIGIMPVTGIPLPFVSYGGSSYLTNMMGIGLAINVAMRSKDKRERPVPRQVVQL